MSRWVDLGTEADTSGRVDLAAGSDTSGWVNIVTRCVKLQGC